jgi:hypothetical protein
VAELVLLAMREHHADLHRSLEAHQREELEHHRRVDVNLETLVRHKREQDARILAIERRLTDLEAHAPTEPPACTTDSLEPGGDS